MIHFWIGKPTFYLILPIYKQRLFNTYKSSIFYLPKNKVEEDKKREKRREKKIREKKRREEKKRKKKRRVEKSRKKKKRDREKNKVFLQNFNKV